MAKKTLTIGFKIGIHSRPAALVVMKVRQYTANEVIFTHKGKTAPGNSLIGLLTLGIAEGSEIMIEVKGPGDDKVLSEILEYFAEKVASEG
jgi:phosphocarrier protein HPr